ncbi:MAG: HAD family hydrolase [Thermomicrobiales bacterium]
MTDELSHCFNDSTWLFFDGFGSLIDWEGGMACFLYTLALRSGDDAPPRGGRIFAEWEAIRHGLMREAFRPYRDVLSLSLRAWCQQRGYEWDDGYGAAAKTAMRAFQPFPEAYPVLRRALAAGKKLAVIVDADHDIINHNFNHLPIDFDEVIVSEDCRSYKPSPENFSRALQQTGAAPDQVLYVATDLESDIAPARRAGMLTAWINRAAVDAPDEALADHIWRNLWELADLVAPEDEPEST